MKVHISNRGFRPKKKMMALALFDSLGFMPTPKTPAQSPKQARCGVVRFDEGTICQVNGIDYPVDDIGQIWAIGNGNQWFVIGHIVYAPYGVIAGQNYEIEYPVVCQ